jgi:hypothetical protein
MSRTSSLGGLLIVLLAAGCTGPADVDKPAVRVSSPSPSVAGPPDGFGTRHVSLTCADANAASAADVPGRTDTDGVLAGLTAPPGPPPPRAEDVGLRLPPGLHWYFRKAPLAIGAGTGEVTVAVAGTGQALAWVPSSLWTSGSDPDLGRWAASAVTLHGCPDRAALFLGGVLAADPTTCLQLSLRAPGSAERTVRQRLDGSACR